MGLQSDMHYQPTGFVVLHYQGFPWMRGWPVWWLLLGFGRLIFLLCPA